jgi:hypothetical protein
MPLLPSIRRPSRLSERLEKVEKGELSINEMSELTDLLKARAEVLKLNKEASALSIRGGNDETGAAANSGGPNREQIDSLLKEVRELIGLLKAERQGKKPAEGK